MSGAILAAFAWMACASCADPAAEPASAAALSALVLPHVERIARFDRWAHRVASASGAWRSRSALEETAFSQVRGDDEVLAAWIEHPGEPVLAHPPGMALPDASLRALQVGALGHCEVARARIELDGAPTEVLFVVVEHDGLRTMLALARTP